MGKSECTGQFPVLGPNLQVSFYERLEELRDLYLLDALGATVAALDIEGIDRELPLFASKPGLTLLASCGMRGELVYAVPYVLAANPFLLGYYRLLYGFSQKEFYGRGPFGRFKHLEEAGIIRPAALDLIDPLCQSLGRSADLLLAGVGECSRSLVHDLQLLTLGPQLRGGANTQIGQLATKEVFRAIKGVVRPYVEEETARSLLLLNESGRKVLIEFFADPDVAVREVLESTERPVLSIEIKGGRDASNIHNRLGEAEKSHQKAKEKGFREFWTVIRVDIDEATARRESPTTSRFFNLDLIQNPGTQQHTAFRDLLCSFVGIRTDKQRRRGKP